MLYDKRILLHEKISTDARSSRIAFYDVQYNVHCTCYNIHNIFINSYIKLIIYSLMQILRTRADLRL